MPARPNAHLVKMCSRCFPSSCRDFATCQTTAAATCRPRLVTIYVAVIKGTFSRYSHINTIFMHMSSFIFDLKKDRERKPENT